MAHEHEDLIDRALGGSDQAVQQLVDLLTPAIQRRAAWALLRNRRRTARDIQQEVEDVTQDVFLALFENKGRVLKTWDPTRGMSLRNFAGLIADRHVASTLRSGRKGGWAENATDQQRIEAVAQREVAAETRVASREMLDLLLDRLQEELSPLGLELFYRLMVHQESVSAVCESTGMSTAAIHAWRSRLARTAKKLSRKIEAECDQALKGHKTVSVSTRSARIP